MEERNDSWYASDLITSQEWSKDIPQDILEELLSLAHQFKQDKVSISSIDFDSKTSVNLKSFIRKSLTLLKGKYGFVIFHSLFSPIESEDILISSYRIFASMFGQSLPQNRFGELFCKVQDETGLRGSKTNKELPFHTDSANEFCDSKPDFFLLYALRVAEVGGQTLLANAQTIHNEILQKYPKELERLYKPFFFERSADLRKGDKVLTKSPIFFFKDNNLAMRYNRFYIENSCQVSSVKLNQNDISAIETIEKILIQDNIVFRLSLKQGDVLIADNYKILHSRTRFNDSTYNKRCYIRIWIKEN